MVLDSAPVPLEDAATVARRLQISVPDFIDSLKGLEGDLGSVRERIEKCTAETDLETLETTLDRLAGSAQSLGALRLGPVLKALSETCRDQDVARIQEGGANSAFCRVRWKRCGTSRRGSSRVPKPATTICRSPEG